MITKERPKAILVDLIDLETSKLEALKRLEEVESLVTTYGGIVVVKVIQKRGMPDYQTFIGKGKVEEIGELAKELDGNLLVVNNALKSGQIFNLEEFFRKTKLSLKVWDRVDLILKIFEKHAKSTEAKLQIELAAIKHMGPRIFGMGIELGQQKGGTSMRAGQGETNIELMKRHLSRMELTVIEKLKHYELIREGHRKRRQRQHLRTAALVGYTNAGKSSVLHALTGKDVYIADELFATLDTRVGNLYIPENHSQVLISDTIGFIRDLPPSLIQAFKSTLAETVEADLILHVIDVSDPEMPKKIKVVEEILEQLGLKEKPKIYVFNKTDLAIDVENFAQILEEKHGEPIGILEAGENTAHQLGWHKKDRQKRELKKEAVFSRSFLEIKYKKYTPVFISAVKKENLKKLTWMISKRINGK